MNLFYQKSPDQDGFEVMVLDTDKGEVVWKGVVSEVTNNDR